MRVPRNPRQAAALLRSLASAPATASAADAARLAASLAAEASKPLVESSRKLLARLGGREALCVHHVAVVVARLPRAERFYRDVLGLKVVKRWTDEGGRSRSVWLELGNGAFLAVERAGQSRPVRKDEAPGWHCVAFAIEPAARERWRTRLERAGHPVFRETAFTLYVRDPDGNVVALSHHPVAVEVEAPPPPAKRRRR
ncbi:MAG: VOC family protein [bacterium]